MKNIDLDHQRIILSELQKALDSIQIIGELCAKEKYYEIMHSTTTMLTMISNVSKLTIGQKIDKSMIGNQDFTKN